MVTREVPRNLPRLTSPQEIEQFRKTSPFGLTPDQLRKVQVLVPSFLGKKGSLVLFGESSGVKKAVKFFAAQARERRKASIESALRGRRTGLISQIERAEQSSTPGLRDLPTRELVTRAATRSQLIRAIEESRGQSIPELRRLPREQLVKQVAQQVGEQRLPEKFTEIRAVKEVREKFGESNEKLPFEKATEFLPSKVREGTKAIEKKLRLEGQKVIFPEIEVPLKQTISSDRTGRVFLEGKEISLEEFIGAPIEQAVALGQFAIPYVGTTLFVGSLIERPILAPDKFKQEFAENPTKTAVLFGLGLLAARGGVKGSLTAREQRLLNKEFKNAKTQFLAQADENTIQLLSRTNIRGKPIITRSQAQVLKREGKKELQRSGAITFKPVTKDKVEVSLSQAFSESKALGKARLRRDIKKETFETRGLLKEQGKPIKASIVSDVRGTPFRVLTSQADRARVVYNSKKGFNIVTGKVVNLGGKVSTEIVPLKAIKSEVVGVITPNEAGKLFKVIAGSPRLRIYKSGGVNYVFNPKIGGWLKIKSVKAFSGEGKTFVLRQIQTQTLAAAGAARIEVKKIVEAEAKKLGVKAKEIKKATKVETTIGGGETLQSVKQEGKTLSGVPALSTVQKEKQKLAMTPSLASVTTLSLDTAQKQVQRLKSKIKELQKAVPVSAIAQKTQQLQEQQLKTRLRLKQAQVLVQKAAQSKVAKTRAIPRPIPKLKIPLPFKPTKDGKVVGKKLIPLKKQRGYHTFVKSRGKSRKANIVPRTKQKANDLGAWVVDRTTSRQWFIKKARREAQKGKIATPINYSKATQKKYRSFKVKKGVKKPLKNQFIEKRKHAIDTLGEKKQLSAAREISRLKKKVTRRPKPFKFKRL